jgi:hypothetical protein
VYSLFSVANAQTIGSSYGRSALALADKSGRDKDWRADAGGDVGRRYALYRPQEATPEPGPIPVLRI